MTGKGKRITSLEDLRDVESVYVGNKVYRVTALPAEFWKQPIYAAAETDLPVCPFCGSVAEVHEDKHDGTVRVECFARCYTSRKGAIQQWCARND